MNKYYGLTAEEASRSIAKHGKNVLEGKKRISFGKRLLSNLNDPIIRVLLFALVFNIVFTLKDLNIAECIGIFLAVIVSTLVSTLSEQGSERAFEKLSSATEDMLCKVLRDGVPVEIPSSGIAVGDCVLLGVGDAVPADGLMLDGEILVNQAALNGESKEAKKRANKKTSERTPEAENRVFRGSLVTRGSGIMEVTEVGKNTFLGSVASDLSETTRESPLKLRLTALARTVSRIGYVLAALVALSYLFDVIVWDNGFQKNEIFLLLRDYKALASHLLHALTLAITIVVVAVPEGLPMMICVVLSSNMKRMLRDQILVKKMVGIETAGSLNILFSDKTGTFTTGNQTVSGFLFYDGKWVSSLSLLKRECAYPYLLGTAVYNTECRISRKRVIGSNATDRAIVSFFQPEASPLGPIYGGLPFDSRYKYSAAGMPDGKVLVKGAPEILIPYISHYLTEHGTVAPCCIQNLEALTEKGTEDASRLICIAYSERMPSAVEFPSLVLVAFAVINDPLRTSTKSSIDILRKAGIHVVMVTGDGKETACAIARKSGLIPNSECDIVLTSDDMKTMSDETLGSLLPRLCVVARALPQDKTRLVRIAQERNLVTGMTGDGVNDAPALKLADVGFAMGSGTDVAKEAGDIVILDNDMEAMVKSVLYGRTIFKSIRKFIIFQLTMNLCAVGITLLGPILGVPSPITVIQMLWINMIMDTLGGLAFAGEAPQKHTLEEMPKRREEPLLSWGALGKIVWNGVSALAVSVLFLTHPYIRHSLGFDNTPLVFYAAFFSLFIFMGVVMFYIARSDRLNFLSGLLYNTSFLLITFLVTVIQLLMVYIGGETFRTTPLPLEVLLGVLALALVILPLDLVRRAIFSGKRRE